jgi:predicted transcriptional regulator
MAKKINIFDDLREGLQDAMSFERGQKVNLRDGNPRIAAENNRGTEEYVRQLVEHYLDHDAWFRQKVKNGLDQLDHEEFVTHEEIGARIARRTIRTQY